MSLNKSLQTIKEQRDGGSIAIRGFNFQFLYACFQILQELSEEDNYSISLEGIEDIDILHHNEFIQVKSSKNSIDASTFWNMGVLKNYFEVYQKDSKLNFRFVHNTTISNGNLKGIEKKKLDSKALKFWEDKIKQLDDTDNINIQEFLQKITFEKVDKESMFIECKKLLLEKFDLNTGTEEQCLFSLLYYISQWSEHSTTIRHLDVLQVVQSVKDASSKTPTNEAIKQNLITPISYDIDKNSTDMGYFDGKSAKPIHIALGLPVERKHWQTQVQESLEEYDVTVIKSSSGQGKSTLAWQTAYSLRKNGYSIYQLRNCNNFGNVEEIVDFIETRVKIGLTPLIVVDGLDQGVKEWDKLAERLFDLPVKIIVTTREEDWYRYGLDISKVNLKIVDIKLFQDEAKSIFTQLKEKNKLHEDITNWQSIWEKIEAKGLLIEYVYLLTHGSMIKERLNQQIKELNQEEDDVAAKLEILRMVSLADILNIKIQTKKLTEYIQQSIGFSSDRGELYKILENEYYVQFDKKYVEGLHPVRSQHLVDILHETLSIEESLINLLKLIDNESIYDYFITVPFLIGEEDKKDFFEATSEIIASKNFINIVEALDGLMHYEPYSYWLENKDIYDDVYNQGLIQLFVNFNPPFSDLNSLEEINKTLQTDTSKYVVEQKNNLSIFTFENTFVVMFCLCLSKKMVDFKLDKYSSYDGLAYLIKWFKKTKAVIPEFMIFDENFLLKELQSKEVENVVDLYVYFHIVYPQEYLQFIERYKYTLFSILKEKTNSLIIQESDNELDIQYLASNESMDKLNECSMERIDILKEIFVHYNKFNSKVIYLPFPNEEMYKYAVQESYKAIPRENLFDEFDIHLNVIWRKTIMRQYSYETIYEWQEYYRKLRLKFIEFMKACNKLFEYILEGKKTKDIYQLYQEIFSLLQIEKEFPVKTIKYNDEEEFEDELKNINDFKSSYKNFVNQLTSILDQSNSHLPLSNLHDAYLRLSAMQNAFDTIQKSTYEYFDMEIIKKEEILWLDRLLKTVQFFVDVPRKTIVGAKEKILVWHEGKRKEELETVYAILESLKIEFNYKVYYPVRVIEKKFKEIVIGIEDFEEGDLGEILFSLVDFYESNIDYINIIRVHNKEASYGFRVSKAFFGKVQIVLDGGDYVESEFGNPLPLNVTGELLETLNEKIVMESQPEEIPKTIFIEIMYDIWKLTEYRARLDKDNKIENEWREKNELEIISRIKNKIDILNNHEREFITQIMDRERSISKEEIVVYMNDKMGIIL